MQLCGACRPAQGGARASACSETQTASSLRKRRVLQSLIRISMTRFAGLPTSRLAGAAQDHKCLPDAALALIRTCKA